MEERRTAAFQAVTIMHKRNVSAEPARVGAGLNEDLERRCFRAKLNMFYMDLSRKVYDVLGEEFGHPADDAPGHAELKALCLDLAGLTGDILLEGHRFEEHLTSMKQCLRFVAAAFKDWNDRQPPAEPGQLRAALLELFDAEPVQENGLNTLAARLHFPVPAVKSMLDELVAEGLLRCKGICNYSKVRRRPKAKAA